jgi:membrane protein DedA with SNARE-associated domain
VRPVAAILFVYLGYAAGSLQVLAFKDKFEILGILLAVSILLVIIAGAVHGGQAKGKQTRTIPRRSSAKNRSKAAVARR